MNHKASKPRNSTLSSSSKRLNKLLLNMSDDPTPEVGFTSAPAFKVASKEFETNQNKKISANLRGGVSIMDLFSQVPVQNKSLETKRETSSFTVEKILSLFVDPSSEEEIIPIVLYSYSTFINAAHLLAFLCQEYWKINDSENLDDNRQYPLHPKKERILNILKQWIEYSVEDFKDIRTLFIYGNWQALLSLSELTSEKFWAKFLRRIWEIPSLEVVTSQENLSTIAEAEKEEKKIKKCKSDEIFEKASINLLACQLTLMDYELFKNLKINDLLELLNEENGMSAIRNNFNLIIQWLITLIVTEPNLKSRVHVLEKIIDLGCAFMKLNNMNGGMKVFKCLSNPIVFRLKNTWKSLSNEHKTKYKNIYQLFNPQDDYLFHIELVNRLIGKKTSFIPCFLIVLEELEKVRKDYERYQMSGINYDKIRAFANVMNTVKKFQRIPFNIVPSERLQKYFKEELYFESTEILQQFSKKCESSNEAPISSPVTKKKEQVNFHMVRPKWRTTSEAEKYFSINLYAGRTPEKPQSSDLMEQMVRAVQSKDVNAILFLLKNGFPLKSIIGGQNFYHIAAELSCEPLLEFISENALYETKPDINASDGLGWTPLHIACNEGTLKIIDGLIKSGARVSCLNRNGATPLHYMVRSIPTSEMKEIYLNLLEHLAGNNSSTVNIRDINLETPLHRAVEKNNILAIQFLLKHRADLTLKNNSGDTPLKVAHKFQSKEVIDLLSSLQKEDPNSQYSRTDVMYHDNWVLDIGNKDIPSSQTYVAQIEYSSYYSNEYSQHHPENLIGKSSTQGVVLVSILPKLQKMLIRSKQGDRNVQIPKIVDIPKMIETMKDLTEIEFSYTNSHQFSQFILEAEDKISSRDYAFDVLYIKQRQFTLKDAYQNTETVHSPVFQQFLSLLGKKVPVGGWGGLAQYEDEDDEESSYYAIHTKYKNQHNDELDIFFHISTFMSPKTKQKFGSRSVAIVFLESTGLDLNIFSLWGSKLFLDVIIVIQPHLVENVYLYKLTVCFKKNSLRDFGPPLHFPAVFSPNEKFKQFLLTKVINAEYTAMSPAVKKQLENQKDLALQQLYTDFKNLPLDSQRKLQEENQSGIMFYKLSDELGRGSTGIVYKAIHRQTKKDYCIKVIDRKNLSEPLEKQVRQEIKLLRKLNHKYILKAYENFENEDKLFFVLEVCYGGSLQDDITKNGIYIEPQAAKLMYQLLDAVNYMHIKNISHRDLKPENILFSDSSKKIIKIIDFGFGKDLDAATIGFTMAGTLDYIAPEIIDKEQYDYYKIDMWSCGCIAYFLLFGKPPFTRKSLQEMLHAIRKGQVTWSTKQNVSDLAKTFILNFLSKDANKRPNASEAAQDEWILQFKLPNGANGEIPQINSSST